MSRTIIFKTQPIGIVAMAKLRWTASRSGNPEAVKVSLDHGAKVNTAEARRSQTALMRAR
jgi:hypothetical protein